MFFKFNMYNKYEIKVFIHLISFGYTERSIVSLFNDKRIVSFIRFRSVCRRQVLNSSTMSMVVTLGTYLSVQEL